MEIYLIIFIIIIIILIFIEVIWVFDWMMALKKKNVISSDI